MLHKLNDGHKWDNVYDDLYYIMMYSSIINTNFRDIFSEFRLIFSRHCHAVSMKEVLFFFLQFHYKMKKNLNEYEKDLTS